MAAVAALKISQVPDGAGQSQFVESRVLYPSSFNQQHCRFLLPTSGIFQSKDAYITLQLQAAAADHFLPLFSGILGSIDTATLYYNNIMVAQTRNVNHLSTMKRYFKDPHYRNRVGVVRHGGFSAWRAGNNTAAHATFPAGAGKLECDVEEPGVEYGATVDAFVRSAHYQLLATDATPEYRVYLKTLFPMMSQLNIPLGLLEGRMAVELIFARDLTGLRVVPNTGTAFVPGNNILEGSCRLICDMVYYDDPIDQVSTMDAIAQEMNSGNGIQMVFTDNVAVQVAVQGLPGANFVAGTGAVPVGTTQVQQVSHLLGVNGQVIRKVWASLPFHGDLAGGNATGVLTAPLPANQLLGGYFSQASQAGVRDRSNPDPNQQRVNRGDTLQLTINSQPWFPSPLNMDCKMFNQLCQCAPTPFKVPVQTSSLVGQLCDGANTAAGFELYNLDLNQEGFSDKTLNGTQLLDCEGGQHYFGINLARTHDNVVGAGVVVGNQPVKFDLDLMRTNQDGSANLPGCGFLGADKDLYIWVEAERQLTIKHGEVFVSGS